MPLPVGETPYLQPAGILLASHRDAARLPGFVATWLSSRTTRGKQAELTARNSGRGTGVALRSDACHLTREIDSAFVLAMLHASWGCFA